MTGKRRWTRRDLLVGGGTLIASSGSCVAWASRANDIGPDKGQDSTWIMHRLSEYMSQARKRPLPPEVIEAAKQHILDTVAAMVSGAELPPAKIALQFASRTVVKKQPR